MYDARICPLIDIDYLERIVYNTAATGFIDPPEGLSDARVWLYSALNDSVVAPTVVWKNAELYSRFLSDSSALQTVSDHPGEHAVPTFKIGNPCDYLGPPYINACGYSAAAAGLAFLYGPEWSGTQSTGNLFTVNQSAYFNGPYDPGWGLAETGYLWMPDGCATKKAAASCNLHIHFHGCLQSYSSVGFDYIYDAGFSGWNDTIVLYPQAIANALNPNGCFDWWGYTGPAYASNIGVQNSIVKRMVDDLVSGRADLWD